MVETNRDPTAGQFMAALLGLAIGDALGRPTEGKRHDEIRAQARETLLTFRSYRDGRLGRQLPAGSWSDDTQQALLLADSLAAGRGLDAEDFSDRMYALWKSGEARGYGGVYQRAMEGRDAGQRWDVVAVAGDTLNGAAMRIVPLGLFYWYDPAALTEAAVRSSRVTHADAAAAAGAAGVALAIAYALTHAEIHRERFVAHLQTHIAPIDRQMADHLSVLGRAAGLAPDAAFRVLSEVPGFAAPPREGRGSGVSGLTVALLLISTYLFLHTEGDYLRAVEGAILLGGDTDGTAATAGAICAAWRGAGVLPPDLATTVEEAQRIRTLGWLLHGRSLAAAHAAGALPVSGVR
ncbi:MAG: ADP-ribosylglycohydrolase family protein [Chloroflexota bacterium]